MAYTVEQAAEALNMGLSQCFELVHVGRLHVVKLGRKLIIPMFALDEFLRRECGPYIP